MKAYEQNYIKIGEPSAQGHPHWLLFAEDFGGTDEPTSIE
jgi:hypothetical protein